MGQRKSSDLFNLNEKVLNEVIFGSNHQVIKLPLLCFGVLNNVLLLTTLLT